MSRLFDCQGGIEEHKKCQRFYYSATELDPKTGRRKLKECDCPCHKVKTSDNQDEKTNQERPNP